MSDSSTLESLKRIIEDRPSHVGELSACAEEDLSRAFGKLRNAVGCQNASAEETLRRLEEFGEALRQVEERCSRVSNYYRELLTAVRSPKSS